MDENIYVADGKFVVSGRFDSKEVYKSDFSEIFYDPREIHMKDYFATPNYYHNISGLFIKLKPKTKILPNISLYNIKYYCGQFDDIINEISFKMEVILNNKLFDFNGKKKLSDLEKFDLMINEGISYDSIEWNYKAVVEEFFEKAGLL